MPARRRHRTPKPRPEPVQPQPVDEVEQGWREHQQAEQQRRAPVPLDEQIWRRDQEALRQRRREETWQEILRAKAVVEADFARWDRERMSR